jgi:hypothetical protein
MAVRSGHAVIQWMSVPLAVKLSIDAVVVRCQILAPTDPTAPSLYVLAYVGHVIRSLGERSWLQ